MPAFWRLLEIGTVVLSLLFGVVRFVLWWALRDIGITEDQDFTGDERKQRAERVIYWLLRKRKPLVDSMTGQKSFFY